MTTHVTLSKIDLGSIPGLDLPTVDPGSNALFDNDAKVCRIISDDELHAAYVDDNIDTFQLQNVNLLTLDVDNQFVTLTYANGAGIDMLLGWIDYAAPPRTTQYGQTAGIIYPIDANGNPLLNATNTPNLVAIRKWYAAEARRVNDQRVEIAEVVHSFAEIIGTLGNAAEHTGG